MIELVLLATTDLHTNLRAYDYYKDAAVPGYGLTRVATLIAEERKAHPQALLLDAGDFLQGSPMGDVYGKGLKPVSRKAPHPAVAAFAALRYDAVALGNHEFDFGLGTLRGALASVTSQKSPFVSANVFLSGSKATLVQPSVRAVRTINGQRITACVFGITPTQILLWNKDKLAGKIDVEDGLAASSRTARALKASGCDTVVALVHGGFNPLPYTAGEENPAWHIAGIPEVDAVVGGHVHQEFPSAKFDGLKEANVKQGLVRGKPAVIAGQWGSHLGVITLRLEKNGTGFKVTGGTGALRAAEDVPEERQLLSDTTNAHAATLAYVRAPVGAIAASVDTYFSRIESTAAVDIVNEAQTWYASRALAQASFGGSLAGLPLLSAAAPFKAGFKGEFTSIAAGNVAVKNVADLYVYPNTLQAVALTGAQVKDWLEKSAEAFAWVKPDASGDFPLLNETYPSYNFDVISGVTYEIDVTRPAGERIVSLAHAGKPIDPAARFVVATNNYRAGGGGKFPHLGASAVVWDAARENREVLFDYFRSRPVVGAKPAGGWKLHRVEGVKGRVWVDLSEKAAPRSYLTPWPEAQPAGLAPGFVRYSVDLARLP